MTDVVAAALAALGSREPRRIGLVLPRPDVPLVRRAPRQWPAAAITPVVADPDDLDATRDELGVGGPFDLVLDVAGKGVNRRVEAMLGLVRLGGRYVGRRQVVTQDLDLLWPLREADADRLLRAQPERGRVLETRPAVTWESRGTTRLSRPMPGIEHETSFAVPGLGLREHRDVVCLPYQAAYQDGVVLAESFREFERRRLRHPSLESAGQGYVERPALGDVPGLSGSWFLFDTGFPDHFGHAVTEQLSHVWGWEAAKARDPGLRALVFAPPRGEVAAWAWRLWEAAGLARADVEVLPGPVRVERLLACSPMLRIKQYAHPAMADVWGRAGETLAAASTREDWPARVFHTRRGRTRRACHNVAEVEAFFAERGFTVLAPEDHDLADQVDLARHAEVVAGFAGSGMYQIAFTREQTKVIALATEAYPAHNEHLMAALLGHDLHLVVCTPDVRRPDPEKFSADAYASGFTFDAAVDGAAVDAALAG